VTSRTFCRLLAGPTDATVISDLSPDDWRLLADTARGEGVASLLYHSLDRAGWSPEVPPDVQFDLRQAYYATTAANLLIYRELSQVLTALATAETTADRRPPTADDSTPKSEIRNPQSPFDFQSRIGYNIIQRPTTKTHREVQKDASRRA